MMSDHVITLLRADLEAYVDLKRRCKAYRQLASPADYVDVVRELAVRLELAGALGVAACEDTAAASPELVSTAEAAPVADECRRAATVEQVARRVIRARAAARRVGTPQRSMASVGRAVVHLLLGMVALAKAAVELLVPWLVCASLQGLGAVGPGTDNAAHPKALGRVGERCASMGKRGRPGRPRRK